MNRLIEAEVNAPAISVKFAHNTMAEVFRQKRLPARTAIYAVTPKEVEEFALYCFDQRIKCGSKPGCIWTENVEGFTRHE